MHPAAASVSSAAPPPSLRDMMSLGAARSSTSRSDFCTVFLQVNGRSFVGIDRGAGGGRPVQPYGYRIHNLATSLSGLTVIYVSRRAPGQNSEFCPPLLSLCSSEERNEQQADRTRSWRLPQRSNMSDEHPMRYLHRCSPAEAEKSRWDGWFGSNKQQDALATRHFYATRRRGA
ncbi:hypothetical protein FKP32DRAFT_1115922 [Trametes sanguinea]|nr:hypothetical protein FKP32DRAFT_1115922 [Trametes sanguinea]